MDKGFFGEWNYSTKIKLGYETSNNNHQPFHNLDQLQVKMKLHIGLLFIIFMKFVTFCNLPLHNRSLNRWSSNSLLHKYLSDTSDSICTNHWPVKLVKLTMLTANRWNFWKYLILVQKEHFDIHRKVLIWEFLGLGLIVELSRHEPICKIDNLNVIITVTSCKTCSNGLWRNIPTQF